MNKTNKILMIMMAIIIVPFIGTKTYGFFTNTAHGNLDSYIGVWSDPRGEYKLSIQPASEKAHYDIVLRIKNDEVIKKENIFFNLLANYRIDDGKGYKLELRVSDSRGYINIKDENGDKVKLRR